MGGCSRRGDRSRVSPQCQNRAEPYDFARARSWDTHRPSSSDCHPEDPERSEGAEGSAVVFSGPAPILRTSAAQKQPRILHSADPIPLGGTGPQARSVQDDRSEGGWGWGSDPAAGIELGCQPYAKTGQSHTTSLRPDRGALGGCFGMPRPAGFGLCIRARLSAVPKEVARSAFLPAGGRSAGRTPQRLGAGGGTEGEQSGTLRLSPRAFLRAGVTSKPSSKQSSKLVPFLILHAVYSVCTLSKIHLTRMKSTKFTIRVLHDLATRQRGAKLTVSHGARATPRTPSPARGALRPRRSCWRPGPGAIRPR